MTLSDLAKYSMTRSDARPLCDSWASCIHNNSTSWGWGCGTLCPFISRTAIWLLQLSCASLSLISFLSNDLVLSAFGVWSQTRYINSLLLTCYADIWRAMINNHSPRGKPTSSAVAKGPRDASCLSVISYSFNSIKRGAQSFIVSHV